MWQPVIFLLLLLVFVFKFPMDCRLVLDENSRNILIELLVGSQDITLCSPKR